MPNSINKDNKPVRIWDVIYWDNAKKIVGKERETFSSFELYTLLAGNIAKENPGMMKRDDIVFYDVTGASPDFIERNKEYIDELQIKDVIKRNQEKKMHAGKLISIVPAASIADLTGSEKNEIGHAFCTFIDGKIKPVVHRRGHFSECDDLYISVDPSQLSPELYEKISGNISELICNEEGQYQMADSLNKSL